MTPTISLPDDFGTRFSVSIDTEEEFDWDGTLARTGHGTAAVSAIDAGQRFFEAAGVTPLYYVDQPILDCDRAIALFRDYLDRGTADFGIHLHPWVTPPFVEQVNRHNSYAGNLAEDVERAKLCHVRNTMIARLGHRPLAYRAGRYGIGPNSWRILAEEGFVLDSSVRSLFDYRADGGPDFRQSGLHPWRVGPEQQMIEVPLTTICLGRAGRFASSLYGWIAGVPRIRALLARTGIAERIPLTPEGIPADKACDAIDVALERGLRLLNISFHSPSLAIGHTPYVRSESDLEAVYHWFDRVFEHCAKRGVTPATLGQILHACGHRG